uniref:Ig-like domain-containing protein n=1 Tax=Timema genevievae TaxID=629358 RepID=A0A7R9PM40_TIMGE|nr:unnamed protein product [Timema genevievae]
MMRSGKSMLFYKIRPFTDEETKSLTNKRLTPLHASLHIVPFSHQGEWNTSTLACVWAPPPESSEAEVVFIPNHLIKVVGALPPAAGFSPPGSVTGHGKAVIGIPDVWGELEAIDCLILHASRPSVHLVLPPVVSVGSSATLLCLFDLENDPLYSVKWYRGNFEFYRYVPKERPPGRAFSFPGLFVDVSRDNSTSSSSLALAAMQRTATITGSSLLLPLTITKSVFGLTQIEFRTSVRTKLVPVSWVVIPTVPIRCVLSLSNDQQVSLLDVQLHLAGKFSCEVSADAPFFTTITVSDRLRVIDLRDLSPEIFVDEIFSENDHFLHANCTSHHSKPPPELTFFINNIAVSREYVQTWSNGVALQINLTLLSPNRHEFTIKCVASVLGSHHVSSDTITVCRRFNTTAASVLDCHYECYNQTIMLPNVLPTPS